MKFEDYLSESKLDKKGAEAIISAADWKLVRRGVIEADGYRIDLDKATLYKNTGRLRDPSKTIYMSALTLRKGGLPVFSIEKRFKGESQANDQKHEASIIEIAKWLNSLTKLNVSRTDFK